MGIGLRLGLVFAYFDTCACISHASFSACIAEDSDRDHVYLLESHGLKIQEHTVEVSFTKMHGYSEYSEDVHA